MGHRTRRDISETDWTLEDPGDAGALLNYLTGIVELVTGGAETRTLAAPTKSGLRLTLAFKTDGGNCVVTCATGLNVTANTVITFDTAGEMIELLSVPSGSNFRWRAQACLPEADTATLSS